MTRLDRSLVPWLLATSLFALASTAASASALGCSRRIVTVGDRASYVREVCGEPTEVHVRTESRTSYAGGRGPQGWAGSAVTITVEVEVWIYDFGPRRFVEELVFEEGVVRSMRALGYGTASGRRASAEPRVRPREAILPRRRRMG